MPSLAAEISAAFIVSGDVPMRNGRKHDIINKAWISFSEANGV